MKQPFSIFVINLPSDVKRREVIEKRLKELGASYEVVDGIYGNDEMVAKRYEEELAIKEHGKPLLFGEKGCALAHALVYERIIKENIPYSVILEDDIILPDNFLEIVEKEINKKNKKWDWLSFDYRYIGFYFLRAWFYANYIRTKQNPSYFFYACLKTPYIVLFSIYELGRDIISRKFNFYSGAKRFYRPLYNAGAYVLTLDGAKKLIPFTNPLRFTADHLPNAVRFKTNFNFLGYVPLIVKQNSIDYDSGTGKTEEEWAKIIQ